MKYLFLLVVLVSVAFAFPHEAFACGCPSAYCVAVSCRSSGCFGQVAVCTCTGPLYCYRCRNFGTITCFKDSYI